MIFCEGNNSFPTFVTKIEFPFKWKDSQDNFDIFLRTNLNLKKNKLKTTSENIFIQRESEKFAKELILNCDNCEKSFENLEKFYKHQKDHIRYLRESKSNENVPEITSQVLRKQENRLRNTIYSFSCNFCKRKFKNRTGLKKHETIHDENRILKCCTRSKNHDSEKSLSKKLTNEKAFACDLCEKRFKTNFWLTTHSKTHENDKREFLCQICPKILTTKIELIDHILTHGDERQFSCDYCDRKYYNDEDLRKHIKLHSKERPFKCHLCPKNFTQKFILQGHIYSHTGEKRVSCKFCNKTFANGFSLKTHIRTHTGERPYLCHLCNKKFNDRSNLRNHIVTHTSSEKSHHECKNCGKIFYGKSDLKKHYMYHHHE